MERGSEGASSFERLRDACCKALEGAGEGEGGASASRGAALLAKVQGAGVDVEATPDVVEAAFRKKLSLALGEAPPPSSSASSSSSRTKAAKKTATDAGIDVVRGSIGLVVAAPSVSKQLPFTLLEELCEGTSVGDMDVVLDFVDELMPVLSEESFMTRGKLVMLRLCNDLLRRLARVNDAVTRGRVLIMLAAFLPLSERSGVNLHGAYNVRSVTEYEDGRTEGEPSSSFPAGDNGANVDPKFYEVFWGLQATLANPMRMLAIEGGDAACAAALDDAGAVLKVLEAQVLAEKPAGVPRPAGEGEREEDEYVAKLVTDRRIFGMQLRDSAFQRQVLLKMLIVLDALCAHVPAKSGKSGEVTSAEISGVNRARIQGIQHKIRAQLVRTPPDGADFLEAVEKMLQDEQHWSAWKASGCPAFERTPLEEGELGVAGGPGKIEVLHARETAQKKRGGMAVNLQARYGAPAPEVKKLKVRTDGVVLNLGSEQLTELWNQPDNADCLVPDREMGRGVRPRPEEFFEEVVLQADPAEDVEDEYKLVNDKVFRFKALRLMARTDLVAASAAAQTGIEGALPDIGIPLPHLAKPKEVDEAKEAAEGDVDMDGDT